MNLYEVISVWKRISPTEAVCYRCFRNLSTKKFSVQSADFYRLPLDPIQVAALERQCLELFTEQVPDDRSGSFNSIEEAILVHDAEF